MLTVSLVTLGDPEQLTGGYLYHRRMAELAPTFDANIEFASLPTRPFPLPAIHAGAILRRTRDEPPDVLLVDSIAAAFIAPWLVTNRVPAPLAAILHQPPGGIDHAPPRRRTQALLDLLTYRRAAALILASDDLARMLPPRLASSRLVTVVAPGRDTAPQPDEVGDLRRGRRTALLCVGNWVQRKGLLELLDAFATLPADLATLHLAGSTETEPGYASRVRARLDRADLTQRVVVHGAVPKSTVAGLYRAADAFVLASLREPYGTVYGEAMAAGLPVVGWAAGNLPHLATHEQEGLIVPPGDVGALAAALRRICEDEPLRRRMGAAAARRAERLPTWQQSAARLFDVLRALRRGG